MRNSTRTRRWDGAAIQGLTVVIIVALALLTLAALAPGQGTEDGRRNVSDADYAPHALELPWMPTRSGDAAIPR